MFSGYSRLAPPVAHKPPLKDSERTFSKSGKTDNKLQSLHFVKVLDLSISPRTSGENSPNRCSRRRKRSSLCSGLHELPAKVNRGKKLNVSDVRLSCQVSAPGFMNCQQKSTEARKTSTFLMSELIDVGFKSPALFYSA
ncbi:hypothetical protein MHYP_G00251800 [Metynnis hypsauchen]